MRIESVEQHRASVEERAARRSRASGLGRVCFDGELLEGVARRIVDHDAPGSATEAGAVRIAARDRQDHVAVRARVRRYDGERVRPALPERDDLDEEDAARRALDLGE